MSLQPGPPWEKTNVFLEHLAKTTSRYVMLICFEDGAVGINGRVFSCSTERSVDSAKKYLQGIDAVAVIYRVPGASGNLLELDAIISVPEMLDVLEERKSQL